MMKQRYCAVFVLLLTFFFSPDVRSQEINLLRVDPPSWWTGFKNNQLRLLIYGKNISLTTPEINYKGLRLTKAEKVSNPNYLFLSLELSKDVKPGSFDIIFNLKGKEKARYSYKLNPRLSGSSDRKGFSSNDVVYLLMPDRFSNGDTLNDTIPGLYQGTHREDPDSRHGGDISGIINHLDYLEQMGFTALWCTPLLENNMKKYSYHGYSITDHYKIDPRFGTNDDYRKLAGELHERGMKLILDMVFNHCGVYHWWMNDLPSADWIHQFPEFTRTSYRVGSVSDPYHSASDQNQFENGWFDVTMPDLNQKNHFLADYLIENTIWWIEYAGIDGIRVDTYPYCDKDFMARWDKAVLDEYPDLNIVGECWAITPEAIAYWQKGSKNADGYKTELPSVIDFAMYDALRLGFVEEGGWSTGIFRLYDVLSHDFVYPEKNNILTFADNHDVGRYLASQDQDIRNLKMALVFLMTSRGIPQVFYGTEALLTTTGESSHGKLRMDFPGGWNGDKTDFFENRNLTPQQLEMKDFTKKLLNWRKNSKVIHSGKLTHFVPSENTYVYFRSDDDETVMVIINNDKTKENHPDKGRYSEFLNKYSSAKDVITGKVINDLSAIVVPPKSAMILELQK